MKFIILIAVFCLTLGAVEVRFRDFSGACQGGNLTTDLWQNSLGWNRIDISWAAAEPEQGKWNEAYLKKMYATIKRNLDANIKFLPCLAYAPGWAAIKGEHIFQTSNKRKVYTPADKPGIYRVVEFKKEKDEWIQVKESEAKNPKIPLDPAHYENWKNFIRKVATDLSQEPYNLEYFQIWNEAHPGSGFYDAPMDEYMQNIHTPAAEVIHGLGRKVVYGGFPVCGSVDQLVRLITKHKAWNTIDVLDIHYFPEWCMDYLRRHAAENGRPDMGVWQTEIVFHRKYYAVGTIYPTVLYWGLSNNWDYVDRYKLFFFALGSPNDPKVYGFGKNLMAGNNLTPHGQALKTLGDIFKDHPLAAYPEVKSTPELKFQLRDDRIAALKFGNQILVASVFTGKTLEEHEKQNLEMIKLEFPGLKSVQKAERVGVFGETLDITGNLKLDGKGVSIEVPLKESAEGRFNYMIEEGENLRRPVFYLLLTL